MSTATETNRRTFTEYGAIGNGGDIGGDGSGPSVARTFIATNPDRTVTVVSVYAYAVDMWERFHVDEDEAIENYRPRWDVETHTTVDDYASLEAFERGDDPTIEDPFPEYRYPFDYWPNEPDEEDCERAALAYLESLDADMLG